MTIHVDLYAITFKQCIVLLFWVLIQLFQGALTGFEVFIIILFYIILNYIEWFVKHSELDSV